MPPSQKRVARSFSACWTCRRRRVRCDRVTPSCGPCLKHGVGCEGYAIELVWVDPKTGAYPPYSRRSLNCSHTWHGRPVLTDEQLQQFIDEMDYGGCGSQYLATNVNPFVVFAGSSPQISIRQSPTPLIRASSSPDESSTFYHYMTWVAPLMIPVDSVENPWKTIYPSLALQDSSPASQSLYHAMLAQAGFNIANLQKVNPDTYRKRSLQALQQYTISLRKLRECLESPSDEYETCMATLYTLVIVEGYAKDLFSWRNHFKGAEGVVIKFINQQPWKKPGHSWVISQSLALSFEVARTGTLVPSEESALTNVLLDAVSSHSKFGYTIGANGNVLCIISAVRRLSESLSQGIVPVDIGDQIQGYLSRLKVDPSEILALPEEVLLSSSRKEKLEYLDQLHLQIFRTATIIYLYRTILNVSPGGVAEYVSAVLDDTMTFMRLGGGAISLWPVFVAAVEACSQDQQNIVEQWLNIVCELGIENRHTTRRLILQVWEERSQLATISGLELADVKVDWRDVQRREGIDLLLL